MLSDRSPTRRDRRGGDGDDDGDGGGGNGFTKNDGIRLDVLDLSKNERMSLAGDQ